MEQARYWMWAKTTKPDPINPGMNHPYVGDSWEEQAFAEDAAGTLGGCVWPPRSYSCTFCRREFKSAQALGGHMNVHRRDRARLKQSNSNSPTAPDHVVVVPHTHALNTCTSFDPPQISTFLYTNPNPDQLLSPLSSHLLRVSPPTLSNPNFSSEENLSPLGVFSPLVRGKNDKDTLVSSPHAPSWSSFLSEKRDCGLNSTNNDNKRPRVVVDPDCRAEKEDCVTEDMLNFVVSSDEEVASCKRRRIEAKPSSFLPKLSAAERCMAQSEVFKICPGGSVEEPDLELRLGSAPKVK